MPYFNPPNKFSQDFNKKTPFRHDGGSPGHTHAKGGSGSYRKDPKDDKLKQTGVGGKIDKDDYKKPKSDYSGLGAGLEAGLQELGAAIASATAV